MSLVFTLTNHNVLMKMLTYMTNVKIHLIHTSATIHNALPAELSFASPALVRATGTPPLGQRPFHQGIMACLLRCMPRNGRVFVCACACIFV
jgi:hypothetical protein